MKLHKLSSLDPIRTKEIRDMVNICTAHDGTSLSFPFEDGELFLLIEEDHRILSSIAFVPVEESSTTAPPSPILIFADRDFFRIS